MAESGGKNASVPGGLVFLSRVNVPHKNPGKGKGSGMTYAGGPFL